MPRSLIALVVLSIIGMLGAYMLGYFTVIYGLPVDAGFFHGIGAILVIGALCGEGGLLFGYYWTRKH